ncbi:YaeQ family protein [Sulfurimonas sp. SAG-AH-194-C21]|nr:YaeQ family protein [Sulfurimonas sp. SAG-AH-194-C21]MDF1883701.1 YaeQ family protein [Sulfurimonas sp. SAG-AH-194-C21]
MAPKATIYKANVNIANMDTHYYVEHPLVLAQHPSENDLRLMVRLTAFILNANETLEFTKGIDQDDEPDLWQKSMSGDIELSIILGQPDEKRIKKASGTSNEVIIYCYQDGMAASWFKQNEKVLKRFKNVRVIFLSFSSDIEVICSRSMELQCNTDDRELTIISGDNSIIVDTLEWK